MSPDGHGNQESVATLVQEAEMNNIVPEQQPAPPQKRKRRESDDTNESNLTIGKSNF